MASAIVLVVAALVIGAVGVAVGMLVAPRITRLAERDDDERQP